MGGQLGKAIERLGSTGRLVMIAIALATVGTIAYLVMSAGPASYVPAYTNLDPKTAGRIQQALAGAKIPSKLTDGAATVLVPGSKLDDARVALAHANVVPNGNDGWQLLDKLPLSTTQEQYQNLVQRATAGNLESTIEKIQGIQAATVTLALPRDTVFTQDQRQPTAGVLLDTGGGQLTDDTVTGIVNLVASSVPGLTPDHVTVTNERGEQLNGSQAGIGAAASGVLSAEASWNRRSTARAQALLDSVLGPGNARVVVTAKLNFDKRSETQQQFGALKGALQAKSEQETLKGPGSGAGGQTGVATNVPGTPAGANANGGQSYNHQNKQSTNALDTTVTNTEFAQGNPTDVSVALVLSKKAEAAAGISKADLQNQVQQAVGANGAKVSIQTSEVSAFADPIAALKKAGAVNGGAPAAGGDPVTKMLGPFGVYLKPALAVIGLLVFLFLVRRSLRRRQALLSRTDSSWLPALEAPPIKIEELMPTTPGPSEAELAGHQKKQLQGRVEELAQQRPNDVAMQLRSWLSAEE